MSIQWNPSISQSGIKPEITSRVEPGKTDPNQDFGKAVTDSLKKANNQQQDANTSIVDLLSGKQQDVNTVVASVAKADMSFKLLVGVRNKLVEAYKETMRMQV